MSGARFVRFFPSDWRSGCIGLTPEEEGTYIRVCAHFWETGVRVPADDADGASRLLMDVRMWRRIKAKLVAKGKLHVAEDGIYSPRAEREFAAATRAAEKEAPQVGVGATRDGADGQHADGRNSMEGRRSGQDTVTETSAALQSEVAEKSRRSLGEVSDIFGENANKINGPLKSHNHSLNQNHKGSITVRTEFDAPREATSGRTAAFGDLKNWFNGATGSMLEFIDGCMGPGDNRANSENWLASTVAAHGAQPVAQAFAMLAEKRASGATMARPLAHWSNVAASLKAKAAAPQGSANIKPGGAWEALQRRIKASEEAAA